jgi:hypothetical protein
LVKLLLTAFATSVLLLKMELIGYVAGVAAETTLSSADLRAARTELVVHASGGLVVLLIPMALSVYKPRDMTRYGWRKQYEQEAPSQPIRGQHDAATESRCRSSSLSKSCFKH